jgi:hypothetical protein
MALRPLRRPRSVHRLNNLGITAANWADETTLSPHRRSGDDLPRAGGGQCRLPPRSRPQPWSPGIHSDGGGNAVPEAHESFRAVIGALCLALQANREAFLPLSDASWGGYPRPVSKRKAANPMPSC